MDPIIQVQKLNKTFKDSTRGSAWLKSLFSRQTVKKVAVDGISFSLKKGEFVGFLGPNGAGKSTTIKMLTGILTPTSGSIHVNGIVPYEQRRTHAFNIGVVFGQRTQLWWDLAPHESFKLLAKIYRIPKDRYEDNLNTFRKLLDLDSFINTPVRKLSLGQKMRCELAAALLHDPKVLFLDEPTIGLDLLAKEAIREFLKKINRTQETTVLLTTHDLDDVDSLCERVIIIDKGSIIQDESLNQLKASFGNEKIIAFELDPSCTLQVPQSCRLIRNEANTYYIGYSTMNTPELINIMLQTHKVHDIGFVPMDINEIIKRAYLGQKQ